MKIRSGFVSNSSSSSFIVGFDKRPKSAEELKKLMFGDRKYVTYFDREMLTEDIALRVFRDIKDQKRSATKKQILENIRGGWFDGRPEYNWNRDSNLIKKEFQTKFPNQEMWGDKAPTSPEAVEMINKYRALQRQEWNEDTRKLNEAAKNYVDTVVLPQMKGKKVFLFEYADDSGESILEHGDIFSQFPHVQISRH